ncbi:MAG: hypothetical protein C5B43_02395 [Verrucomicrobia bacterium]|nr:MAG: hypothetical protein C5B43_02395 [Verrucomicrobiota bacterium]
MSNVKVNTATYKIENNTCYGTNRVIKKFVENKKTTLEAEFKGIVENEGKTRDDAAQILFDRAVVYFKDNAHNECYNTKVRLGTLTAGFATLAFYSMVKQLLDSKSLTGSPIETMISVFLFAGLAIATIAWLVMSCLRFKEKTE